MKDIFNRRQRFSLRKYSVGVCSVLLGTALFAAGTQTVLADEVENPADSSSDVISSEATSDKEIALSKPVTGESSAPTSYNVAAVVQPSVATDSQHEGDKEAGKEATAEPTETVSREATGTSGFRNSGEVTSRVVSNWNGFVSALNDNSIQNITISGNVVATGDNGNTDNGRVNSVDRTVAINSQGRNVVIQGRNDQASLDLLSNSLKFTGSSAWNLVFKNLQLATGNSKGAVDLSSTTGANTVTFENVK
ncbi:YSIRK-type signal peptide-containing protein, partial [Streptococcus parasanguinis]